MQLFTFNLNYVLGNELFCQQHLQLPNNPKFIICPMTSTSIHFINLFNFIIASLQRFFHFQLLEFGKNV